MTDAQRLADRIKTDVPNDEPAAAIILRVRALGSAFGGDFVEAGVLLRRSIEVANGAGSPFEAAVGLAELARLPGVPPDERDCARNEAAKIAERLDLDLGAVMADVPWATRESGRLTTS
jgi:hypothetical protein